MQFKQVFQFHVSRLHCHIMTAIVRQHYRLIYCRHNVIILVPIRMNVQIEKVFSIRIGWNKQIRKQIKPLSSSKEVLSITNMINELLFALSSGLAHALLCQDSTSKLGIGHQKKPSLASKISLSFGPIVPDS